MPRSVTTGELKVGARYVSTDQAGACKALKLPLVVRPLIFVTVKQVFPEQRKAVVTDDLWISFSDLNRYFRPRSADA